MAKLSALEKELKALKAKGQVKGQKMSPELATALYNRGMYFFRLRKYDQAMRYWDIVPKNHPKFKAARTNIRRLTRLIRYEMGKEQTGKPITSQEMIAYNTAINKLKQPTGKEQVAKQLTQKPTQDRFFGERLLRGIINKLKQKFGPEPEQPQVKPFSPEQLKQILEKNRRIEQEVGIGNEGEEKTESR